MHAVRTVDEWVLYLVDSGLLSRSPVPHACSYLSELTAVEEAFGLSEWSIRGETYVELMNRGFRRSGQIFYRPICEGCRRCVQIRIPVADFRPTRSQRKAFKRNAALVISTGPLTFSEEKYEIYNRYLEFQHPGSRQSDDKQGFKDFLYVSPIDTIEVSYTNPENGKLVAVSIMDLATNALSSVYHYFDPDYEKCSLGVYSVVAEIELAKRWGIPYYYLGYWVEGASTMAYKANYTPHEVLIDGRWERREAR